MNSLHFIEEHNAFVLATHDLRLGSVRTGPLAAKHTRVGHLEILPKTGLDELFQHALPVRSFCEQ
jgi:hypothetical protein